MKCKEQCDIGYSNRYGWMGVVKVQGVDQDAPFRAT